MRECVVAREASRQEQQCLEAEKRTSAGRRRRYTTSSVRSQSVTPLQMSVPNMPEALPSTHLWLGGPSFNPLVAQVNPSYFYNPMLLPHVFLGSSSTLNVTDGNVRVYWIGN